MRYLYFQPNSLPPSQRWTTSPHHQSIVSLLRSCSRKSHVTQIHGQMIRCQLVSDAFLLSQIIAFLTSPSSESCMAYARRLFDQIPQPNLFMWNSIIRGYTHHGAPQDGLLVYKLMLRKGFLPDSYTLAVATRACTQFLSLTAGEAIHCFARKCGFQSDMFVMSGFVNFYGSTGKIDSARAVFSELRQRDVVTWTSMLSAYGQMNRWDNAFQLLDQMHASGVEPNNVTMITLLSACGQQQAVDKGQLLHSRIVEYGLELDVDVCNSLISMYAKCGFMSNALKAFKNMHLRNSITWNTLIGGFVQNGQHREALTMFEEMTVSGVPPDKVTLASALSASAHLGDLRGGKILHTYIEDHMIVCDASLKNSLINMYAKCGDMTTAESIFNNMAEKDVISWTAMICGYVQGNRFTKALKLFEEMQLANVKANEVTLVSLLSACSQLGALDEGRRIHTYVEEKSVSRDAGLESALVDMYAKCGCIEIALQLFDSMPHKETLAWNAMIGGLASNGHGKEAMDLFNRMHELGNPKPDGVTLKAALCACAHAGMVSEGFRLLGSMPILYGIIPEVEHYGCMVDLLSRAGLIDEAFDFIKRMPVLPNSVMWGSILSACRIHQKVKSGEKIAKHMMKLAPDDKGVHVLLSNIYAEEGRWDDVRRLRTLMDSSKGIQKLPGCSTIEVDGTG